MVPVAHAGHWAVQALMFAPVIAFIGWLVIVQLKDRMGRGDGEEPVAADDDAPEG